MYVENIKEVSDVKALDINQLPVLAAEIREVLLSKLSAHGGHLGPNLGIVELTIALHYVFHSPVDKFVFDVSHQSYTHKILTGRKDAFIDANQYDSITGYTNPAESEHDMFTIGHTSTSISLACGLAKGRDLRGGKEHIIAIIGDGSLSGGEALEALSFAGEAMHNLIIIVNDNEMSIASNHGGLYRNLKELRYSHGAASNNLFKAMGLDYRYLDDGHDLNALRQLFEDVKDIDHPIVLHIHTEKGRGYVPALQDKEMWHWHMPFDLATGRITATEQVAGYDDITAEYLLNTMKTNPEVVAITSGTPSVFGFHHERRVAAGTQFIDVGIAEEHAVALASGIAANGGKPVYGVYSTFIQRSYDQLSQDLCLNNNPALLLVFAASIYGMNDVTHLGIFDIAMMGNIPNLVYLAPTCKEEYLAMLEWGLHQHHHPVAIRVPAQGVIERGKPDTSDYSQIYKFEVTKAGSDVAIIAAGNFYTIGEAVVVELAAKHHIHATLINPKFINGLDEELLHLLTANHQVVITLEDGILEGGFGQKIAGFYGAEAMSVKNYGMKKEFIDRYDVSEIMIKNRITKPQIIEDILAMLS